MRALFIITISLFCAFCGHAEELTKSGLPLYWWQQKAFVNFGDYISLKLVERIVGEPVKTFQRKPANNPKKLLALGSILSFADDGDVIWGTGLNGKLPDKASYRFKKLDVRAVRGPITRAFLQNTFSIPVPEVYGDPALLFPYLFPEFTKSKEPLYDYIVIPHYTELHLFPRGLYSNVIYPTDPWDLVVKAILQSKFVISSSLHGIIIAEAYGIPARMLRVTETEPLLKYNDYYRGSGRVAFEYAETVQEALEMGGELPLKFDPEKLYEAFPFEFWSSEIRIKPDFKKGEL